MSPRPKNNSQKVEVFFTPEVVARLREMAADKGLSLSALLRMMVLESLDQSEKK